MSLTHNGGADCGSGSNRFNKALKDPNWRSRSSESGAEQDTTTMKFDIPNSGFKTDLTQEKDCENKNRTPESLKKLDGKPSPPGGMGHITRAGYPVSCHKPVGAPTWNSQQRDALREMNDGSIDQSDSIAQHEGLAVIKGHVRIHTLNASGPPLSLIKLEPISPEAVQNVTNNAQSSVDDQRLAKVMHLPGVANATRNQKGAPTGSAEVNGIGSLGTQSVFSRTSGADTMLKTDFNGLKDAQISAPTGLVNLTKDKASNRYPATSDFRTAFPQRASEPQQIASNARSARYERLLLKLKEPHYSEPDPNEAACRKAKQHARALPTSHDTQVRWEQPIQGEGRRGSSQNFSGDSGYASLSTNASHRTRSVSEHSPDAQGGLLGRTIPNRFNPRARDFLPLTGSQEFNADQCPTRNPVPPGPSTLQNTNSSQMAGPEYVNPYALAAFPSTVPPILRGLSPLFPMGTNLAAGLNWPPRIEPAYLPTFGLTPMMNSIQTPSHGNTAIAASSALPPTQGQSGPSAPAVQRVRSQIEPFHHQVDRTILPSLMSVPMTYGPVMSPYYGHSTHVYGSQYGPPNPMSASQPHSYGPPRAVPKPRSPNAMAQNEYEAWIEHRKATTPGYALECRIRQQNRAQRKLQNRRKEASARKSTSETVSSRETLPTTAHASSTQKLCDSQKNG
jgi:hypothetical protein